jgi:hypothetical protein
MRVAIPNVLQLKVASSSDSGLRVVPARAAGRMLCCVDRQSRRTAMGIFPWRAKGLRLVNVTPFPDALHRVPGL